jgi:hypothetical protein
VGAKFFIYSGELLALSFTVSTLYHRTWGLSRGFSNFFEKFFRRLQVGNDLQRRPINTMYPYTFNPHRLLTIIYYHIIAKKSTPFSKIF